MTDPKPDEADPAVKPQVIDLKAEDVTDAETRPPEAAPPPAEADEPPPDSGSAQPAEPEAAPPRRGRSIWFLVTVAALAAAAGGFAYRNLLSSYFPTAESVLLKDRIDALEAAMRTADTQREALSTGIGVVESRISELQAALANVQNTGKAAQDAAGALTTRLDALETGLTSTRNDLDGLRTSLSQGTAMAGGTASDAALTALAQRIDAIEKDVAALKSRGAGAGGEAVAVLTQSLAGLRAKIAGGEPYAAEYDRLRTLVPAASGLETLAAFAGDGLPDAQGLASELRAVIPGLPPPDSSADEGAGGGIWDMLKTVITIRRIGERDWPGLAGKTAAAAESGDLAGAVRLIEAAQGEVPADLARWRDRAKSRLRLEAAAEEVGEAVLRQIAATGNAP